VESQDGTRLVCQLSTWPEQALHALVAAGCPVMQAMQVGGDLEALYLRHTEAP
jgi:hypothetical protein